jgi:ferredoxin
MHVEVDEEVCAASGQCAARVPEVFTLDEEQNVARVSQSTRAAELAEKVEAAAARCPVLAITVTRQE